MKQTNMKIRLGVFFGGKSVEHEVSVITAIQAIGAINKGKYEVTAVYISKDGEMYCGEGVDKIDSYTDIPSLLKKSVRVVPARIDGKAAIVQFPMKKFSNSVVAEIDVAFPMGHGTNVEDGALQGYLQTLGVPYAGCDVLGAAVGMNKYLQKIVLEHEGIPVLPGIRAGFSEYGGDFEGLVARLEDKIGYPMIVKPINLGSSVGIKIGRDKDSLSAALEHAFMFAGEVLVERAVLNLKEVNVSVLGDICEAEASECEEPIAGASGEGILSYCDKYTSGAKNSGMASLSRKIPADITAEEREKIRDYAVKAFRALGCNGVARLDFLIDTDSGDIFFNEINTLPGSLAFYLWEPVGVKYPELLDRIVMLALKREREKRNLNFSFETNILQNASFGLKGGKIR